MRSYNGFRHKLRDFYTSLRFEASGSVSLTNLTNITNTSFSICAWVCLWPSTSNRLTISGSTATPELIINSSGIISFGAKDSSPVCLSGNALSNAQWHHIAITFNKNDNITRLYLDGEDVGASNTPITFNSTTALNIGLNRGSYIVDFKIYSSALTQSDIRADCYHLPTATVPIHRFEMNDAVGNNLVDSGSSPIALGSILNCTFAPYQIPYGQSRQTMTDSGILLLDGSGDYISTTNNLCHTAFNGEATILLSTWVKLARDASYCYPIGLIANGTTHARLEVDKIQTQGTFRSNSGDAGQVSSILVANSSYHRWADDAVRWSMRSVLVDFVNKKIEHYRNGVLFSRVSGVSFSSSSINYNASNSLAIGATVGGGSPVRGCLGPTHICAGTITKDDIRQLYLKNKVPGNKTAYWTFGDGYGTTAIQKGNVANFNATLQGDAKFSYGAPI